MPVHAERTARNILSNATALGIQFFASLTVSAMIARRLRPTEMGGFSYQMWIATFLPALVSFGIPHAISKYVSEKLGRDQAHPAAGVARYLLRVQAAVAAMVALAVGAAVAFTASPWERLGWALILLMLVPQALRESYSAAITGCHRFDLLARVSLYSAVVQLGLVTAALALGAERTGILFATLLALLAGTTLTAIVFRRLLPRPPTTAMPERRSLRELLGFAFSDTLILLVIWQRPEVFFLNHFSAVRDVAFFSIGFALVHRLNELGYAATSVLLPLFSREFSRSGLEGIPAIARQSFRYTQMLMVPIYALGIAGAGPLVLLVYGPEYQPAIAPLQILLAGAAVGNLSATGFALLYATGRQAMPAKLLLPLAVLNLLLAYLVVPLSGAEGAAWVKSATYALAALAAVAVLARDLQVRLPWGSLFRIYVAAAAAAAPPAYLAWRGASLGFVLLALALGMPLYFGLLAVWGEVARTEWSLAKALLRGPAEEPAPVIPPLQSFPGSPLE